MPDTAAITRVRPQVGVTNNTTRNQIESLTAAKAAVFLLLFKQQTSYAACIGSYPRDLSSLIPGEDYLSARTLEYILFYSFKRKGSEFKMAAHEFTVLYVIFVLGF